jgi:hypothetical protein
LAGDAPDPVADDLSVTRCPTCDRAFDERVYQVVVPNLGAFHSYDCAEKAARGNGRRSGEEIAAALLRAASHLQLQAGSPEVAFTAVEEEQST